MCLCPCVRAFLASLSQRSFLLSPNTPGHGSKYRNTHEAHIPRTSNLVRFAQFQEECLRNSASRPGPANMHIAKSRQLDEAHTEGQLLSVSSVWGCSCGMDLQSSQPDGDRHARSNAQIWHCLPWPWILTIGSPANRIEPALPVRVAADSTSPTTWTMYQKHKTSKEIKRKQRTDNFSLASDLCLEVQAINASAHISKAMAP